MSITVEMSAKTCFCGTVYEIPNWVTDYICPMCGERRIRDLQNENTNLYDQKHQLDRRIRALKGVITKMKKKVK